MIKHRLRLASRRVRPAAVTHKSSVWRLFFQDLCSNLSLHGLPHIARQDHFVCERVLWGMLVSAAASAMVALSYSSWQQLQHPSVTTTVVTTHNDCADFPFPSFTICDTSRVDWRRASNLTIKDIPVESRNVSLEKILVLLKSLSDITFGDFDFMENLKESNISSKDYGNLNIRELLEKVQRPCEEVFHGSCWWRERFYNCCDIFEVQRTDLGFCYSFNSDISEHGIKWSWGYGGQGKPKYWLDWMGEVRPRRASSFGPWTGLRMTVSVMSPEQLPPGTNITPGMMFYLEEPRSLPNSENQHIDPGTSVEVRAYGITLQAEPRVRKTYFTDRRCLFQEERPGILGFYTEHNCLVECRQLYAVKYCNCNPDFLFVDSNYTRYKPCDVKGLNCLKKHNLVLNTFGVSSSKEFFKSQEAAMDCDCPHDCNSQQYMFDTSISQTHQSYVLHRNLSHIGFDVHIKGQYNVLYKTDVVYGPMEFLVAAGGIAGLCLGGSLLSGVEVLYFFTFRFFYHWKKARRVQESSKTLVKFVGPKYYN